jgi:phytoene dehydrogenase-like protein
VLAGTVVSNADMRQTAMEMLEPRSLDPAYRNWITRLRPTYPCFLSHIGVRGISEQTLARVHGYHWRTWDAERVGSEAFHCKVFVPTLYEPNMAPPGCHVVIVQKVTEVDYDAVDDWPGHKQRLESAINLHLHNLIPGFRKHVIEQHSATAQTSHRFTLNYHGAMLGWEMSPDQLGEYRPDVQSPIDGLLYVGQWTQPGGGITPVIASAMRVARIVTRTAVRRAGSRNMKPGDREGSDIHVEHAQAIAEGGQLS